MHDPPKRMWALRDNLTGYDAAYVAAAEHLGVDLLTRAMPCIPPLA